MTTKTITASADRGRLAELIYELEEEMGEAMGLDIEAVCWDSLTTPSNRPTRHTDEA